MTEKWYQSLNSGRQAAAVLTDLLKAFDCNDNELQLLNKMPTNLIIQILLLSIHTILKESKELKYKFIF